ncbi:MAG: hypothetical protein JKY86_08465 [Gammaproteobacteria bacterium]|nr:hypothetical protein [Gammaproteobacteria bacterium]
MESLISKAKLAISSHSTNDYKIRPSEFGEELNAAAPEIAAILGHSLFREIAKRYEQYDSEAVRQQAKFKVFALDATWAVCISAISGSLLAGLAALALESSIYLHYAAFMLGATSTIFGSFALFRLTQIRNEKLLEQWMSARARAEIERLGLFLAMAKYILDRHEVEFYTHLLFACFFKRYQLDVQYTYYSVRGAEHQKSHEKTSIISAAAAISLALGSGFLGMLGAFLPEVLPFAVLGTIGAAVAVVASRREELNQDERNAERYNRTADILSRIAEKYDDVLEVIETGTNPHILIEYVDAVNDQLSLEHRQWTSDTSEMSSSIRALEKSLVELNKG